MRAICGFAALGRLVATDGNQPRRARRAGLPTRSPRLAASGFGGRPEQAAFPATRETSDLPDPAGPRASRRRRMSQSRRTSDIPASPGTSSLRCPAGPATSLGSVVPKPPETARHVGSPRVPCLEPAQSLFRLLTGHDARARAVATAGLVPRKRRPGWSAPQDRRRAGSLPNRQPGAASCRPCVCSTACCGLTPRCREVKR